MRRERGFTARRAAARTSARSMSRRAASTLSQDCHCARICAERAVRERRSRLDRCPRLRHTNLAHAVHAVGLEVAPSGVELDPVNSVGVRLGHHLVHEAGDLIQLVVADTKVLGLTAARSGEHCATAVADRLQRPQVGHGVGAHARHRVPGPETGKIMRTLQSGFSKPRSSRAMTSIPNYVRGETDVEEYLNAVLKERVMVLDGGMGTMVQVRDCGDDRPLACLSRPASTAMPRTWPGGGAAAGGGPFPARAGPTCASFSRPVISLTNSTRTPSAASASRASPATYRATMTSCPSPARTLSRTSTTST